MAGKRFRKGKQGKQAKEPPPAPPPAPEDAPSSNDTSGNTNQSSSSATATTATTTSPPPMGGTTPTGAGAAALILTSDQRRGVFECDYCHTDISQQPRIRCAVCEDFDVCCDCFATTTSTRPQQQHDPRTHGYRVCDSTRYPIFPVVSKLQVPLPKNNSSSHKVEAAAAAAAIETNKGDKTVETNDSNIKAPASASASAATSEDGTMMDIDEGDDNEKPKASASSATSDPAEASNNNTSPPAAPFLILPAGAAGDDPKTVWTVEEDLRLLRGIETHGLGNWPDVAEAVAGQGSVGKTPRRCMERYCDDYLGRYGHILPPYTLLSKVPTVDGEEDAVTAANTVANAAAGGGGGVAAAAGSESSFGSSKKGEGSEAAAAGATASTETEGGVAVGPSAAEDSTSKAPALPTGEATRASKRRSTMLRSPSSLSGGASVLATKKYKAVPTESLPEYKQVWPEAFLPELDSGPVQVGQEVGRDQAVRAEQTYVRVIASLDSKEQVEKVRKDWEQNRLNKPGGPTVLPMRPDDIPTLPGSELVGFMPRRGDFDVEWENGAEENIADMEFIPGESEQDRQLKLQVLAIYNSKLDEREKRKTFVLSRKLYDYRKHQQEYQKLPRDERDLVHRMRLFERFHTPAEHKQFLADLLKAKRLRKEIAKLQMYRRMGIRTLVEAERYELDKARRQFHKQAHMQKELEAKKAEAAAAAAGSTAADTRVAVSNNSNSAAQDSSSYYWKQYRTTDRKVRKSINRGSSGTLQGEGKAEETSGTTKERVAGGAVAAGSGDGATPKNEPPTAKADGENKIDAATSGEKSASATDAMDVDTPDEKAKQSSPTTTEAASPMDTDEKEAGDAEPSSKDDAFSHLPGFRLLTAREVDLCKSIRLQPTQYLEIKKALICESMMQGLLDDKQSSSKQQRGIAGGTKSGKSKLGGGAAQRSLVKIDVERRGAVIDFVVRAGWVPTGFGQAVREGLYR